jgi:alpha-glucosidase (family GH31 glycosyl hydrolase)
MDFIIRDEYVTVRSITGILDLYIFNGPTFKDVVIQYHDLIGKPAVPPLWALGWHQSRTGYASLHSLQSVMRLYAQNEIPLTSVWHDLDYMENSVPFTVNSNEFTQTSLDKLKNDFSTYNVKYVPVINEGIGHLGYLPNVEGKRMEIFVGSGDYYKGFNQGGNIFFVNYFHPNASIYWENLLERLRKKLDFDGLWLNLNVPFSVCISQ